MIPYQKRTSSIDWAEFDVEGAGKTVLNGGKGKVSWNRVVEETTVSNGVLLGGLVVGTGAVVAGALYRNKLKGLLKT